MYVILLASPWVLLLIGLLSATYICNKLLSQSQNYLNQYSVHEFAWERALRYQPTDEQWGQLQEICAKVFTTDIPYAIQELAITQADFAWAIATKNLKDSRTTYKELFTQLHALRPQTDELIKETFTIRENTTSYDWDF